VGITKEIEERIEFWIKTKFYYVGYPDMIQEYWWQDREGKWVFMQKMTLDHLKASANLIERDLKNAFSPKGLNYDTYKKFLIEPAKKKQAELQDILREKAMS